MVEFKLIGEKYTSIPLKWQGSKLHLYGNRIYDSEKLNIPFDEIEKQLGNNIIWSNKPEVPKAQ